MPTETSLHIEKYATRGGLAVTRTGLAVDGTQEIERVLDRLDTERGVLFSSNYDYPGRYTRWDLAVVAPPLVVTSRALEVDIECLNERGEVLVAVLQRSLDGHPALERLEATATRLRYAVVPSSARFAEEERSKQPSVFSALRAIRDTFFAEEDTHLGLYGAFGYDLTFQFDPIRLRHARPREQRDLVLYLPDELVVVDRQKESAFRYLYDYAFAGRTTEGLPRRPARSCYVPASQAVSACDHAPGEYAASVAKAKEAFKKGDLFELVLSQTFVEPCAAQPSAIFRTLRQTNPAPYALFINLGQDEFLVGASPEMYVRVEGRRVETCPISGTIARGNNAVEDAAQVRELLLSSKEESELTMCTDVDRNDKSRICEPGSVRVIGRRQIELYSRLIHTVDHVEGTLRADFDALDAFLTHTWAVTVTGAPKRWAIQRVEDCEKTPRAWYGGAVGVIGFNGHLNTGLTLRTVRLVDGHAEVRAGATLLYDSEPEAEEKETRIKASAFLDTVRGLTTTQRPRRDAWTPTAGRGLRVLLVDHEDSFVHTLANYLRQTGAEVTTLRAGFDPATLDAIDPHLVFLSPGPGTPTDFGLATTIERALHRELPIFGVCLGLQGIVEYFGGELGVLAYPMHGKPSAIHVEPSPLFEGLASPFRAARYHSLFARPQVLPECLQATAHTDDGVIMAVQHRELPVAAVQFHPESILTLEGDAGLRLLDNAMRWLARAPSRAT